MLVNSPSLTSDRIDTFRRRLPVGFQVLALRSEEGRSATLRGPCTALRTLRLGCPATPAAVPSDSGTPQVQELARWSGNVEEQGVRFQAGPYLRGERTATALAVIADRTGRADVVKQAAYATLPTPTSDPLGYDWLVGGVSQARNGQWLVLFGSIGLAILLLATVVSSLAEFLIFGTGLAPLAVHTDRRRIFLTIGLWHLTVPLLLATVIGAFVAVWQGFQYLAIFGVGRFSWNVLSGAMAGAVALAVLTGLGGGLIAIRAARRWRPTTD
ncbi:hypothetical protein [Actinoallomurus sp. NPDC050550]|uniref:hypothetical protein n=1 Tax=Actinoallomurus sp. NPDC050550 TaxID=3154937 RepID=UPI0033D23A52